MMGSMVGSCCNKTLLGELYELNVPAILMVFNIYPLGGLLNVILYVSSTYPDIVVTPVIVPETEFPATVPEYEQVPGSPEVYCTVIVKLLLRATLNVTSAGIIVGSGLSGSGEVAVAVNVVVILPLSLLVTS